MIEIDIVDLDVARWESVNEAAGAGIDYSDGIILDSEGELIVGREKFDGAKVDTAVSVGAPEGFVAGVVNASASFLSHNNVLQIWGII